MHTAKADNYRTLGAYIRAAREDGQLSQGQLAAAIGVDPSYVARIESGQRAKPAADVLQRIADALDIEAGDLLAFLGVRPDLPAPHIYLRRKYGLGAEDAEQLSRLIEDVVSRTAPADPRTVRVSSSGRPE